MRPNPNPNPSYRISDLSTAEYTDKFENDEVFKNLIGDEMGLSKGDLFRFNEDGPVWEVKYIDFTVYECCIRHSIDGTRDDCDLKRLYELWKQGELTPVKVTYTNITPNDVEDTPSTESPSDSTQVDLSQTFKDTN